MNRKYKTAEQPLPNKEILPFSKYMRGVSALTLLETHSFLSNNSDDKAFQPFLQNNGSSSTTETLCRLHFHGRTRETRQERNQVTSLIPGTSCLARNVIFIQLQPSCSLVSLFYLLSYIRLQLHFTN